MSKNTKQSSESNWQCCSVKLLQECHRPTRTFECDFCEKKDLIIQEIKHFKKKTLKKKKKL